MGRYELLETVAVADCALDIEGRHLDDLFETAARALADVMIDASTVEPTTERTITLTAPSLDLLLYDWLSELIFLKDSEQLVFTRVVVRVSQDLPCRLIADVTGGLIDRERAGLRADVKAVTFHQFALEHDALGWRARIVLDI